MSEQQNIPKSVNNGVGAPETRPAWVIDYKEGPVRKTQIFFASDEKDAQIKAERFISFLGGRDNKKCMLIGKAKPFAVDIDKEIAKISKEDLNVYPV